MRDEKVQDKKSWQEWGMEEVEQRESWPNICDLWQIQGLPSLLLVICIVCQNNHGYWKHLHGDKIGFNGFLLTRSENVK